MDKYRILNHQNNFLHILVYAVVTGSLLKHTDSNITEFLPKILLFLEDCATWGLSQVLSDRKSIN